MAWIKFIHKKPEKSEHGVKGLVIYYNQIDIILGVALILFSAFFIYQYFQYSLFTHTNNPPGIVSGRSIVHKPK